MVYIIVMRSNIVKRMTNGGQILKILLALQSLLTFLRMMCTYTGIAGERMDGLLPIAKYWIHHVVELAIPTKKEYESIWDAMLIHLSELCRMDLADVGMIKTNVLRHAQIILILHCSIMGSAFVVMIIIVQYDMEKRMIRNVETMVVDGEICCIKMNNIMGRMCILHLVLNLIFICWRLFQLFFVLFLTLCVVV